MTIATPTNDTRTPASFSGRQHVGPGDDGEERDQDRRRGDDQRRVAGGHGRQARSSTGSGRARSRGRRGSTSAMRSRRGNPMLPSRHRRRTSSVTDASRNRRNVKPTGGRTARADLTTMKLPAQMTMTTRTAISASRRSAASRRPGGRQRRRRRSVAGGRLVGRGRQAKLRDAGRAEESAVDSGAFSVELEDLLVGLFGQLQPDEQAGQHDRAG